MKDWIKQTIRLLKEYDGEPVTLMEVCGSHTAAIARHGIKSLLSEKIRLISGPGCPVCVTPSAYIDRLIALAKEPDTCVVTFGDLMRVPGSRESLNQAKGEGARVHMVYSPVALLKLAEEEPGTNFVFAAVGFETTTPVYALLLEEAQKRGLLNIRLLSALKTMPAAIEWLCENAAAVDGFIAPGHVCAVTGSNLFVPLAQKYGIPFGVAGFEAEELIAAIWGLVKMRGRAQVRNFYPSVVTAEGNGEARRKVARYFAPCSAIWRGMGEIPNSGLVLRPEFTRYDAGSAGLTEDVRLNQGCCCGQVLTGRLEPKQCPLFRSVCTPQTPQGACMVSAEGSCCQSYINAV